MSRSDKGDGLPSGAGREFASGLRDCSGSLEKGDSPRCGEMSRSDKGDGLPSGAGREFASGLRDCSGSLEKGDSPRCGEMSKGSLEKGAGCEQREQTEGLKGIALFIQIPYAPKKSLRLALTATHLPLQGRRIPPACLNEAHLPLQGRQNPSGLRQVRRTTSSE